MTAADAGLAVRPYAGERDQWDEFVRQTPGGTLFHLIGWKEVLERAFGFTPHYLLARRDGRVVGVLPLVELRGRGAKHCLLSVPFAVDGGVCSADGDAARALEDAALDLGARCGARYLELRDGRRGADFQRREGTYYRFRRPLPASDAEHFAALSPKRRNMIRTGQRSGLTCRVSFEDVPTFYDLYARAMRRLGTPVFPLRYFHLLVDAFRDDCVLLTVRHAGVPAAAVVCFFFAGSALPYYVGSRRDLFRYAVNDFMYWELMCYARRRGARLFDFGRSKQGTGAYAFKRHWGFEPEPQCYRVHVWGDHPLPDRTASDPRVQWLQHAWRRVPLGVTKRLGPFFVRRWGPYYT